MKQSLQLKLGQQLTMTPQLQQAIRLLQLSTLDLQQEIQEALESNPMLEVNEGEADSGNQEQSDSENPNETSNQNNESVQNEGLSQGPEDLAVNSNTEAATSEADADGEWSESIPQDLPVDTDWDAVYQSSSPASSAPAPDDDSDFESRRSVGESLQDHLLWQLNLTPMEDRDRVIAMAIIDAVQPNGLLDSSAEEIFQGLGDQLNEPATGLENELEIDEVMAVLHRVQQFDPPGVAGENLADCLLIQLRQLPADLPHLAAAKTVVGEHIALLGNRDYKTIMKKAKLKEAELKSVIEIIQSLNPSPGDSISESTAEYVVPDVFVSKNEGRWMVQLNPEIAPKIRINNDYASLIKRADSSSENTFLRDNLQEARWFLKSLQSRNETLLKVASCIVEKQQGFLDYGPEAMKPMILHDIADEVDMHESTISRVTTQKFMHTPQGIFELKYFFSSHVATSSGGECSSTAIRAIIKKLVAAENPKKPLSDNKITQLLEEQGIKVARRTIAKYRESLNIPPSNERKRLV
ncbi:RNA polymerase factor sigma-54 [uncultured Pseudoteredinibacter sp.]|uniref:RNA polymerase factor sigma-54 n=1 Tax=uncultured Pseudoteredinibacter sp. TaxID=1641701 RepID=UPI002625652F|nr:RNA polymerase factor sigma-54 [uncultured Pseudoteredinibacter sp.]